MTDHIVASADEIPEGEGTVVEADGLSIAIFNVEGEYYGVSNRCLHKGGPLGQGFLHGDLPVIDKERRSIHCPWHYWEFDLETGRHVVNPRTGIRAFDVRVEDGDVVVSI